jgi:hypothetical protein
MRTISAVAVANGVERVEGLAPSVREALGELGVTANEGCLL